MSKVFTLFFLFINILCLTSIAHAEDEYDDGGKITKQMFQVFNDLTLSSEVKYKYGVKPKTFVKYVYPVLESDMADERVENFNATVDESMKQQINQFRDDAKGVNDPEFAGKSSKLEIDYTSSFVTSGKSHIISVRFNLKGTHPGQKPYNRHFVLNYDLDKSEEIELSSLFKPEADYLEAFSNYTSHDLARHVKDKSSVLEGTAPIPANFAVWNFKKNGILVTFDPAQIASSYRGAKTVLIPYSELKSLLSDESPIAKCINRSKSCVRANLMTGGFVDEARNSLPINSGHRAFDPILSFG